MPRRPLQELLLPGLGLLFAAVFLFATRTEPLRVSWGDPWSDCNVQASGGHFAREGFFALAFTPIVDIAPFTERSLQYTHYPPLPDIVNGVQQSLFGPLDLAQYRILADILSLLSLVFFFRFIRRLYGPTVAAWAIPLMTTSLLWLQYADTIHHVPLYNFFGFLALDKLSQWLVEPRRRTLVIGGVAAAVCAFASYDYVFFLPVMVVASVWLLGKRLRDRDTWPVLCALVAGLVGSFLFKSALVVWAVGPVEFLHDLLFQFHERATSKASMSYSAGMHLVAFGRVWRFFGPVLLVALALMLHALWRRRRGEPAFLSPAPLLLLAAGLPFCVIFSQLFVEQYHPTLQFVPFYAVACATLITTLRGHQKRWVRIVGLGVFGFLLVWQAREFVRLPKAFLSTSELAEVGDFLKKHDRRNFVVSNLGIDAPGRTYWNRYVIGAPMQRHEVPAFFSSLFTDFGPAPIYFVELHDAEDFVMDKLLFAFLWGQKKYAWVAQPWLHKKRWYPKIAASNHEIVLGINDIGVLELATPNYRVYRVDPGATDVALGIFLHEETTRIDFADPMAVLHKVYGLARVQRDEATGDSYARIVGRAEKDWQFTLKGLIRNVTERVSYRAAVQARLSTLDVDKRLTVRLRGTPGTAVELDLNGTSLGSWPMNGEWTELQIALPRAAVRRHKDQVVNQTIGFAVAGGSGGPAPAIDIAWLAFDQDLDGL
jgi:hypothetical protein